MSSKMNIQTPAALSICISAIVLGILDLGARGIFFAVAGVALFFIYMGKGKFWALLPSILFIMHTGFSLTLKNGIACNIVGAAFCIIPAIILIMAYKNSFDINALFAGAYLFWSGVFMLIIKIYYEIAGQVFIGSFGLSLFTVFVISKGTSGKWAAVMSAICFALSILFSFKGEITHNIMILLNIVLFIISVVCIVFFKHIRK